MPELPDMFGNSIFCDDIRQEIGGKITYVGTYTSVMFLDGDFPFVLPKFAIGVTYYERRGKFKGNAKFQISLPGPQSLIETDVPMDDFRSLPSEPSPDSEKWPPAKFHRLDQNMVLAPLEIPEPGVIKVRVETGGRIAKLGILRIGRNPRRPDTSPQSSP